MRSATSVPVCAHAQEIFSRSFLLVFGGIGVVAMALNLELDDKRYVSLLENLIGEAEFLQNNPPRFVPQEDR
jgi:hypothetical protein